MLSGEPSLFYKTRRGFPLVFSDIHSHILFGTDDGPKTREAMFSLVDAIYQEGVRHLFATSHFHPGFYGNNTAKKAEAFQILQDYAEKKYPDLTLYSGNELHYSKDCVSWLHDGLCQTLNHSRYVLVDFSHNACFAEISNGLQNLLSAGYIPILAHTERYRLSKKQVISLKQLGVLIQLNAQSVLGETGFFPKIRTEKILSWRLCDFVATDTHDLTYRPPKMQKCYQHLCKHHGTSYADFVCCEHALELLAYSAGRK